MLDNRTHVRYNAALESGKPSRALLFFSPPPICQTIRVLYSHLGLGEVFELDSNPAPDTVTLRMVYTCNPYFNERLPDFWGVPKKTRPELPVPEGLSKDRTSPEFRDLLIMKKLSYGIER